ncbi:hypothetical protein [Maricaulis sp.]|uniref:ATP-grasp domain-containing protein n=1 Tax=Maricaulis sp. TaxID=1486257 RepID=UPI00261A1312|nr:hypothetical protein [Maricaulis sp.]
MKIAFLTASCMLKDHPDARVDYWEHDLEMAELGPACAAADIPLDVWIWDDPAFDPAVYDAIIIGTTWDYMEKPEAFDAALGRFASQSRLLNPLKTVRWNMRKTYLQDLAASGARTIPTVWGDRADAGTIAAAFDQIGADQIVIKPVLGAGAWRQARLRRGEALPPADQLPPAECMIQPFLPAVIEEGEYSFLFFNRQFSHCALKRAKAGDYRIQSSYGGHEVTHSPQPEDIARARAVLDHIEGELLYARVDMLRGLDGELAVIEVELIEPYLYPEQGKGMGEVFARALKDILGR